MFEMYNTKSQIDIEDSRASRNICLSNSILQWQQRYLCSSQKINTNLLLQLMNPPSCFLILITISDNDYNPHFCFFTNHIINPLKARADCPVLEPMWPAEDLTRQCLTGSCLYTDPFLSVFLMLTLFWLHAHHFCLWGFASLTWLATFQIKTYCLELHEYKFTLASPTMLLIWKTWIFFNFHDNFLLILKWPDFCHGTALYISASFGRTYGKLFWLFCCLF